VNRSSFPPGPMFFAASSNAADDRLGLSYVLQETATQV